MGTITRSFANNITTSGVLLPASLTNNSIANVTAYNASVATGSMVLLSTQTASNSASISFTTGIDSTYKEYQFWFINCHPINDSTVFQFNMSTDSGSNYNVTKTTNFFLAYHNENGADYNFEYRSDQDLAQSTSYQNLTYGNGVGNDNDQSVSGTLTLFNPASTTYVKHFIASNNSVYPTDITFNHYIAGYGNTTSAINAIRFQFASGNIDDGTILMYGIV
jgi:hypothetical protein